MHRQKATFMFYDGIIADWKEKILAEHAKDSFSISVQDGILQVKRFLEVSELILYKERIFLVPESELILKSMKTYAPLRGHQGFFDLQGNPGKTFIERTSNELLKYVKKCLMCQHNKNKQHLSYWFVAALAHFQSKTGKYFYVLHYRSY